MTGQAWADDAFASVMIVTACYCLVRLVVSWRLHRPADHVLDATHVLMGAAMAAMLLSGLAGFWRGGLEAVFAVAALWFGWAAIRQRQAHQLQHALAATAMIYMLSAGRSGGDRSASGPMGAMSGPGPLALVLVLVLVGYVIWTADQLAALPRVAVLAAGAPARGSTLAREGSAPARAGDRWARGSQRATAGPGARPATGVGLRPATGAGLRPAGQQAARRRMVPLSPRLAVCCDLVMGVTMGYMLVSMH